MHNLLLQFNPQMIKKWKNETRFDFSMGKWSGETGFVEGIPAQSYHI